MSTKHAERVITYASPEDWDSWSNECKKLAHAYDLWQYIDPSDRIRWPHRPGLPEIRDYPRQADPDDPESGAMAPNSDCDLLLGRDGISGSLFDVRDEVVGDKSWFLKDPRYTVNRTWLCTLVFIITTGSYNAE
ncbi:hypothetical protein BKA59DRAFT_518452 [Fusarium tricinctum]|uniref:Uncharacterized protein n=1 Tax=Fusarium tricinctum TaxID=61284 RepID=A0A8K0RMA8_9HYPO|nr:hypothetical protein BKA59DRAFT_518452 [Fusarium tricinctum]